MKKIAIKKIRIKIEIKNKFYIGFKGEIEKKNQFSKMTKKKFKRMSIKIGIKK
jgi:hypothetical protein